MALDPGSIITLTTLAFKSASLAWQTFSDALHCSSASEDLIVQLEIERIRFVNWARLAGLVVPVRAGDGEEEGGGGGGGGTGAERTLAKGLLPIYETVEKQLRIIGGLLRDAEVLRGRYGVVVEGSDQNLNMNEAQEHERVKRFIRRMRRSIKASGVVMEGDNAVSAAATADAAKGDNNEEDEDPEPERQREIARTSTLNHIRWGVRDYARFKNLVATLEAHVTKLYQLLTESQQKSADQDQKRINIIVVGSVDDERSLKLIRQAVRDEQSEIGTLADRRMLMREPVGKMQPKLMKLKKLTLDHFDLPEGWHRDERVVASLRGGGAKEGEENPFFILEKKTYEQNISFEKRQELKARIGRLVLLLSAATSSDLCTPQAINFIDDPSHQCWWLVFRLPPGLTITTQSQPHPAAQTWQPVSLLSLLQSKSVKPPALENRIKLASTLATALSKLFGSSWLHKGIRSENIIFPYLYRRDVNTALDGFVDISSPLLVGFNYSRHDNDVTEKHGSTTDRDITPLLYRHPNYQVDAEGDYQIGYDLYSFGMVLAEIAYWAPLASFLEARKSSSTQSAKQSPEGVQLSRTMISFDKAAAQELRKRVEHRGRKEMAYRVGSVYYGAASWCLRFADRAPPVVQSTAPTMEEGCSDGEDDETVDGEYAWEPALGFYNRVVVPLGNIVV